MITNGSWMIGQYTSYKGIETGIAPTPVGTERQARQHVQRSGRLHLGRLEEPGRRREVGRIPRLRGLPEHRRDKAVVFPAIKTSTDKAAAAFKAKGVDVTAFTDRSRTETTFLFPITDQASQIDGIMHPAMDAVVSGKDPASR